MGKSQQARVSVTWLRGEVDSIEKAVCDPRGLLFTEWVRSLVRRELRSLEQQPKERELPGQQRLPPPVGPEASFHATRVVPDQHDKEIHDGSDKPGRRNEPPTGSAGEATSPVLYQDKHPELAPVRDEDKVYVAEGHALDPVLADQIRATDTDTHDDEIDALMKEANGGADPDPF